MKPFLLELLIVATLGLVVLALVFRNQRARAFLRTLRNAAWLYIAAIFGLFLIELARRAL